MHEPTFFHPTRKNFNIPLIQDVLNKFGVIDPQTKCAKENVVVAKISTKTSTSQVL